MSGHVVKKRDRYYVVLELDPDPRTGRRRRSWQGGFERKRDAQRALVEITHRRHEGSYVEPSKVTVSEYLAEWLEASKGRLRPTTHSLYRTVVRAYIEPGIGRQRLDVLTAENLDKLYADLLGRVAPKTARHAHTLLRKALADAVRKGRLARNVADQADPPKPRRTEMKTWSRQEVTRFLASVRSDPLYAGWRLAAMTGMRRGEVLGLRWKDVDLERGRLSIRQSLVKVDNRPELSEPKTEKSRRAIALDTESVDALRAHRHSCEELRLSLGSELAEDDLVFSTPEGRYIHPDWFARNFTRLSRTAVASVHRCKSQRA